jgi:hypothetical protein
MNDNWGINIMIWITSIAIVYYIWPYAVALFETIVYAVLAIGLTVAIAICLKRIMDGSN